MSKEKSTQKGMYILLLVAMVLGVVIGLMFSAQTGKRDGQHATTEDKLAEVMALVRREYVDDIDVDELGEETIGVLLSELDPHSSYFSAKDAQHAQESMQGSFGGVGLVLYMEEDTVYVSQVMAEGPSDGTGLRVGDALTRVDGEPVSGVKMPLDSVVARVRGRQGTTVKLEVHGVSRDTSLVVRRGMVFTPSVNYFGMIGDTTGYTRLASFTQTSHAEFRAALQDLIGKGMRHLVFDLRGNGGGALAEATAIAGEMLPRGTLIVYTEGEHSARHNYKSHHDGLYTQGRITVMVDEGSASASEVVSGALQDHDRARIVGRRTFGKGLVQTRYNLDDGSFVLLTTARYYTPSGRCIQRSYFDGTEEYYRSYMQQLIDETYADSAFASVVDSTPYYTDEGRVVYGGGGIIPDEILTYRKDTSFIYYNRLTGSGAVHRVANRYVREQGAELLKQYKDGDIFYNRYEVNDALVSRVVAEAERLQVPRDGVALQKQMPAIKNLLKAYIGESLFGTAMFYRVRLQMDDDLEKIMK